MPTTCSLCFPLAANSAVIVSPIFQPLAVAAALPTTTPSLPRSAIEPSETWRFMTSSALVGSTAEKLVSASSKRAWPQPLAGDLVHALDVLRPRRSPTGLNPGAWALEVATYRSALVWSDRTSPNDALSDEAKTPMLTTRVRPIIRAAAVAAVRRGLRVAFCFASSPGRPRSRSGWRSPRPGDAPPAAARP